MTRLRQTVRQGSRQLGVLAALSSAPLILFIPPFPPLSSVRFFLLSFSPSSLSSAIRCPCCRRRRRRRPRRRPTKTPCALSPCGEILAVTFFGRTVRVALYHLPTRSVFLVSCLLRSSSSVIALSCGVREIESRYALGRVIPRPIYPSHTY